MAMDRNRWIGTALVSILGFSGLGLAFGNHTAHPHWQWGLFFAVISLLGWTASVIVMGILVKQINPILLGAGAMAGSLPLFLLMRIPEHPDTSFWLLANPHLWLPVLVVSLFISLGLWLWALAQEKFNDPRKTAIAMAAAPVVVAVSGWAFGIEPFPLVMVLPYIAGFLGNYWLSKSGPGPMGGTGGTETGGGESRQPPSGHPGSNDGKNQFVSLRWAA